MKNYEMILSTSIERAKAKLIFLYLVFSMIVFPDVPLLVEHLAEELLEQIEVLSFK